MHCCIVSAISQLNYNAMTTVGDLVQKGTISNLSMTSDLNTTGCSRLAAVISCAHA